MNSLSNIMNTSTSQTQLLDCKQKNGQLQPRKGDAAT